MARIRTIKPEFWEDEKIGRLPIPCRLFYIGCWNFADDFGCIKNNAALLKSQIFPYDETLRVSEVKKWIDALVNARMLIPIIDDDAPASGSSRESYYVIRTFRSHQVLDSRFERSCISKDKEYVKSLINKAFKNYDVITTCSRRNHDVFTSLEMEMEKEKEKENNPLISPLSGENEKELLSQNPITPLDRKEKVARKRKELDLSFVEPAFQPIMADWLAYKSERGQTYRQKGVEGCYSRLKELSGGSADIARRIVDQSIAYNYAGLFALKEVYIPKNHCIAVGRSKHAIASFDGQKEFKKF